MANSQLPPQRNTAAKRFLSKVVANSEKVSIFATAYEQRIELWCNGNTADFGSVVLGSSPGSSTHLEITSVVSFFVAVSQTNSTIENLLSVQAPQNLSQSLMLHIRHKKPSRRHCSRDIGLRGYLNLLLATLRYKASSLRLRRSSPGSSTHLEITSVVSFFVAVSQTNSTIESLLSVQAPQNLLNKAEAVVTMHDSLFLII